MFKGPSCLICLNGIRGLNGIKVEEVYRSKGSQGINGIKCQKGEGI